MYIKANGSGEIRAGNFETDSETEIMNKAAEYCSSSYKSEISWSDHLTNCRHKSGEYRCKMYATVNCLSESCGSRFCGTYR